VNILIVASRVIVTLVGKLDVWSEIYA